MNKKIPIENLLRWRLAQAEGEAPPSPRAAQLLAVTLPWWDMWPEKFLELTARLGKIQIIYGHAMTETRHSHEGHPVPALFVCAGKNLETSARVLYLTVRDGQLRLRFQLQTGGMAAPKNLEVTFVNEALRPLFSAPANWSVDNEYRIDATLPAELAHDWARLKVTDQMPFRLIAR